MSSGITRGRVLNGECYAHRLQELNYLHYLQNVSRKCLFNSWNKSSLGFIPRIGEKFS